MTFEEMMAAAMKRVDDAWAALRPMVADPRHLNHESKEFKPAKQELVDAIEMVNGLKNAVASVAFHQEQQAKAAANNG